MITGRGGRWLHNGADRFLRRQCRKKFHRKDSTLRMWMYPRRLLGRRLCACPNRRRVISFR